MTLDVSGSGEATSASFCGGSFHLRFDDEASARAAARAAGAMNFMVEFRDDGPAGWVLLARRKQLFPLDERQRYLGRLRTIADVHGGRYEKFVQD